MNKKRYIINGDGLTISQGLGVHRFAAEDIELNCSSSSKEKKNCYKFDFVPLR